MKKKILFISGGVELPGFARYPGPYRLATELRNRGYEVLVIESFQSFGIKLLLELIDNWVDGDTLFVGFSATHMRRCFVFENGKRKQVNYSQMQRYEHYDMQCLYYEHHEINELFEKIRSKGAKVVVGGAEDWQRTARYEADYYFVGQSDRSIIEFSDALSNDRTPRFRLLFNNGKSHKIIHQDDYPFEAFNKCKIDYLEQDLIYPKEALPIEVARGCIFKCTYCNYQLNGKSKHDYVKQETILYEEILTSYEKYGTEHFIIVDDLFNDTQDKVDMFLRVSERLPFEMKWSSYIRLDTLWRYPDMISKLHQSGLRSCMMGIETLHDQAGKRVGKGLGKTRTLEALDNCKKVWGQDVRLSGTFIVGLDGEPIESIHETFDIVSDMNSAFDAFAFVPLIIYHDLDTTVQKLSTENQGYEIIDTGPLYKVWKTKIMDYHQACDIAYDLQDRALKMGRSMNPNFSMMPRLANVGIELPTRGNATVRNHALSIRATKKHEADYVRRVCEYLGISAGVCS
jgi:hypothetical protein